MNRKILSILTSVTLAASAFTSGVFAAPSAVTVMDSANSQIDANAPVLSLSEIAELSFEGPSALVVTDTAFESNTEFETPYINTDAFLFSELSGEGTAESPYLISDKDDLLLFASNVNSGIGASAHYSLEADIDLGGSEWTPVGHYTNASGYAVSFSGVFNGKGHTISNFKITSNKTAYNGLFGLVYHGEIKNLTVENAVLDIESTSIQTTYAGIIAARVVTISGTNTAKLENCHVKESSVTVKNQGTIYAGGITGSIATTGNTRAVMAFCDSDCDVYIDSTAIYLATSANGASIYQTLSAGGLIGTLNAQTNSVIDIFNCYSNGVIEASALKSSVVASMSGGAVGNVTTYEYGLKGGTINISSCSSHGEAIARSKIYPSNSGGFASQLNTNGMIYIRDCYSTANASEEYLYKGNPYNLDPCAGGFIGVVSFDGYSSSMGNSIINCYAVGDAYDVTYTDSDARDTSFVGQFVGYSTAGIFENCYKFDFQAVRGSDIFDDDITMLSGAEALNSESYNGYDFTKTWEIDSESEYKYPTLVKKDGYVSFVSEGNVLAYDVFGKDGKLSAPDIVPTKPASTDLVFNFNYWSLSENGSAFNFASDTVSENTNLYAVFTSAPRKYTLSFVSEGKDFVAKQTLVYGSSVRAPISAPTKDDDEGFFYEFLYWSDTVGGEKVDFTDVKLYGDMTFYAVFKSIDKTAWDGDVAESFTSGFGTKEMPYVISNGSELALMAKLINEEVSGYAEAYYTLGADINIGGNMWVPIGNSTNHPFKGHFDGQGYTVKNFKVVEGQYAGLFGIIYNATVKNVYVKDFDIYFTLNSDNKYYCAFLGGLAGHITSKVGKTEISGVRVSAANFNVKANTGDEGYAYAGNIAGYISASLSSETYITDCFSTSDITVKNTTGYNRIGGLAGQLSLGSYSNAVISRCYNIGSVTSESYHSSQAGGLVGYLHSYGKAYSPPVGASSMFDPTLSKNINSYLSSESADIDYMIEDSFAIASVSSNCTGSKDWDSKVGRIAGELNTYAAVNNVYFPRSAGIVITPTPVTTLSNEYSTPHENLMSADYLAKTFGFDFDNVWTFVSGYDYPVLKSMVLDKPVLRIVSTDLKEGVLSATIQALSSEDSYVIVIGVFNSRNQLIKTERKTFTNTDYAEEIDVVYSGMERAEYIKVSAVEKTTLKPLFDDVVQKI